MKYFFKFLCQPKENRIIRVNSWRLKNFYDSFVQYIFKIMIEEFRSKNFQVWIRFKIQKMYIIFSILLKIQSFQISNELSRVAQARLLPFSPRELTLVGFSWFCRSDVLVINFQTSILRSKNLQILLIGLLSSAKNNFSALKPKIILKFFLNL